MRAWLVALCIAAIIPPLAAADHDPFCEDAYKFLPDEAARSQGPLAWSDLIIQRARVDDGPYMPSTSVRNSGQDHVTVSFSACSNGYTRPDTMHLPDMTVEPGSTAEVPVWFPPSSPDAQEMVVLVARADGSDPVVLEYTVTARGSAYGLPLEVPTVEQPVLRTTFRGPADQSFGSNELTANLSADSDVRYRNLGANGYWVFGMPLTFDMDFADASVIPVELAFGAAEVPTPAALASVKVELGVWRSPNLDVFASGTVAIPDGATEATVELDLDISQQYVPAGTSDEKLYLRVTPVRFSGLLDVDATRIHLPLADREQPDRSLFTRPVLHPPDMDWWIPYRIWIAGEANSTTNYTVPVSNDGATSAVMVTLSGDGAEHLMVQQATLDEAAESLEVTLRSLGTARSTIEREIFLTLETPDGQSLSFPAHLTISAPHPQTLDAGQEAPGPGPTLFLVSLVAIALVDRVRRLQVRDSP